MPRQITCMGSTCISLNAFLMVKAMVWKRCKIDGKNCIVKDKKSSVFFGSQCVGTLWNQKSTEVIEKQWSFQQRSITSKKKRKEKKTSSSINLANIPSNTLLRSYMFCLSK